MNLCSIASGSSGNCIYVGNDNTHLLIDVGISKKRIVEGLNEIGIAPETISGILITHEHTDHISGLGVMARGYNIPIYATVETINAILKTKNIGKIDQELFHFIKPDEEFKINDLTIKPFSTPHDASNPVCYTVRDNDGKVGVATDLGKYDDYIISNLEGVQILLLEANHDINMLHVGPYPYYLKQRILGDKGHLSNENSGRLICRLLNDKLKYIFLGHLSKENNFPELAYEAVKIEISNGAKEFEHKVKIAVANRDKPSEFVTV